MPIDWEKAHKIVGIAIEGCMEETTRLIMEDAKEHTPVLSGTLKSSWSWSYDKAKNEGTIRNPQPYAERVEYGWSKQAPEGMLRIAIKNAGLHLEQAAKENKI